jgi:hypothetical protein
VADLSFPWEMFMQAAQEKNRNRQQMNQDIAGLGYGLGQGLAGIGEAIQQKKRQQILQQLIQQMTTQGDPQQGPPLPPAGTPQQQSMYQVPPGQPMSAGGNIGQDVQMPQPIPTQGPGQPVSGMGGPARDNTRQIQALMMQLDPQTAIASYMKQNDPMERLRMQRLQQLVSRGSPTDVGGTEKGQVTWDTASQDDRDLAIGMYEGRIDPWTLSFRDRTVATRLANQVPKQLGKKEPFQSYATKVNETMAKSLATGKLGLNALSLNTALGHANSALDSYQRVANTNERFLNVPLNKLRAQTNDPNIIRLQATLNALGGELATVFKGTAGTDQEIGKWMSVLSQDLTPNQAQGAIQQINELLNSRLQALQYQQRNVMGGLPSQRQIISPHGQELSERFKAIGRQGQVPPVGATFQGGKVLKVERVQ